MAEAARLGIAVRPPHVNFSDRAFSLTYEHAPDSEQPVLWMGLGQVRDLRAASIAAICAERAAAPFAGVGDLLARVPLTPKEIDHLIRCGALDDHQVGALVGLAGLVTLGRELSEDQFGVGERLGATQAHKPDGGRGGGVCCHGAGLSQTLPARH